MVLEKSGGVLIPPPQDASSMAKHKMLDGLSGLIFGWTNFRGRPIRPDFVCINFRGWYKIWIFRVDQFSRKIGILPFSRVSIFADDRISSLFITTQRCQKDNSYSNFSQTVEINHIFRVSLFQVWKLIPKSQFFKSWLTFAVTVFWFFAWINFRGWSWIWIFRVH